MRIVEKRRESGYYVPVAVNPATGIGVLNLKAAEAALHQPSGFFIALVRLSYGRLSGRSRKARRVLSAGTPTSVSVAHPIGVGLAVKTATERHHYDYRYHPS